MSSILLLGADFQPLAVIGQRRAFGLVMSDKAEPILGEPEVQIKSPSTTFSLPTVIRLRYYVRVPQRQARWSKPNVLRRDKYVCQFCGVKMTETEATVDHIVPLTECRKKRIPPNTWGNTVASCRKCQKKKGDKTMEATGMRFFDPKFEPKTPRANYLVLLLQNSSHDEWKKYIKM